MDELIYYIFIFMVVIPLIFILILVIYGIYQAKIEAPQVIDNLKKRGAWPLVLKFAEKNKELLEHKNEPMYESRYKSEIKKLNEVLTVKYYFNISFTLLAFVVNAALDKVDNQKRIQDFENYKKIILSEKPETGNDYVTAHLKHYGEESLQSPYVDFLKDLLIEKTYNTDRNHVYNLILRKKKIMDAEGFEKSLIKEKKEKIDLDLMSGYEFESFLSKLFKKMGYAVVNTKLSGDQGADLVVERFGEKTVVQAKCYYGAVGNKAVQEVVAAKNHYNCSKAIVITTSYFTKAAISLAKSNKVDLWDRGKLEKIIGRYSTFETKHDEDNEDETVEEESLSVCKICGVNKTNNPDGICDDCKMSMVSDDDIPPNF